MFMVSSSASDLVSLLARIALSRHFERRHSAGKSPLTAVSPAAKAVQNPRAFIWPLLALPHD
jgi:hypothetical protein